MMTRLRLIEGVTRVSLGSSQKADSNGAPARPARWRQQRPGVRLRVAQLAAVQRRPLLRELHPGHAQRPTATAATATAAGRPRPAPDHARRRSDGDHPRRPPPRRRAPRPPRPHTGAARDPARPHRGAPSSPPLALLAAFWFLALAPKRKTASDLGAKLSAAQQQIDSARSAAAGYRAAKASYRSDYATVARLGKAVPTDDDVPSLVYQLESAAKRTDVDFRAVKLSDDRRERRRAAGRGHHHDEHPRRARHAGGDGYAAPGASVGSAGFPTMPFSFTFQGNFFHLSTFFDRLQRFIVAKRKTPAGPRPAAHG